MLAAERAAIKEVLERKGEGEEEEGRRAGW